MTRGWTAGCLVLLGLLGAAAPALAQAQPTDPPAESPALQAARAAAEQGLAHYDEGRYDKALARFEEADRSYPAPQYRVYIARSHAKLGRPARAARAYADAIAMPIPPEAPQSFQEAQSVAQAELQALRPRIPRLQLAIEGVSGARVQVDGELVPGAVWAHGVPLDPGRHTVEVSAPGRRPLAREVNLKEGAVTRLELVLERDAPSPPPPPPEPGPDLGHAGQLGLLARLDAAPLAPGARGALGLTAGVLGPLEIGASALLGRHLGVEPQASVYLLPGAWKPYLNAAAPIFFVDGARPGVRGAAGLQWDPVRRFGAQIQAGGAHFFSVPAGFDRAAFLVSAGIQVRLM